MRLLQFRPILRSKIGIGATKKKERFQVTIKNFMEYLLSMSFALQKISELFVSNFKSIRHTIQWFRTF